MRPFYFPFDGQIHTPQMGLNSLEPKFWLERDERFAAEIALKREILKDHRESVLYLEEEAAEACHELWEILRAHLGLRVARPGRSVDVLEQLALWTQEDWCVMGDAGNARLVAACVCFPSRWNPRDKFGHGIEWIHEPVPEFARTLGIPVKSFLARLPVGRPMWRLNWTIHDSDELYSPAPRPPRPGIDSSNVLEQTFLRVERQTLTRLPKTGVVAFSIRTYITRMDEVVSTPARAELVRQTLERLPEPFVRYRGMQGFISPLVSALETSSQ